MAGREPYESTWRVRVISPSDLTPQDVAAWNGLRAGHPDYDTPLLSPEFAKAVGGGRRDARVSLIEDAQGLAAVFAFHARPDGLARPIGVPFCDYSGPVVRADAALSLTDIVRLSGMGGYRTYSLLDPFHKFGPERTGGVTSQLVRLKGLSAAEYLEQRRAEYPKRFKNFRRLQSVMKRDGYELRLSWGPLDDRLRDALYGFKSQQYRASGLVDLITAPMSRAMLDTIQAHPGGFQASLWANDQFVSGDFGFREGSAFHPWIAVYDPAFSAYSPGNLLQKQVIKEIESLGLESYDLAEGHDHYKKYFTNCGRTIYSADVTVPGRRGSLLSAQAALWTASGAGKDGSATSRLKRRVDQAAVSHDRTSDRIADLFTALRKRGVSATPSGGHAAEAD